MAIEITKHPEPHGGDCDGEVEIRVDKKRKRVTTICTKCHIGSIIQNGKVLIADGKITEE